VLVKELLNAIAGLRHGATMVDPIISLAFSVHANKGVYAVLLGSGISHSAGIPTGWDVVEDLIRRVARLYEEECVPDPETWFLNRFNEKPNYSTLLAQLAKSPPERNLILRGYFEANEEERERGVKVPTAAHKAIAKLVASGHVRVIVTTNFDRLIERALEAIGINPSVIDSPGKLKGAMPLTHAPCTVIKLHGDYMDFRIKNTPEELAKYDKRMNRVLNQVLDEYGLIVCGWSADYDLALEAAIARCPSRRFTTYWAQKGKMGEAAKRLIDLRRAETIQIEAADTFFQELEEKVSALDEFDRPHRMSVKIAVAAEKKYIEDGKEMRLTDLVMNETSRLLGAVSPDQIPTVRVDRPHFQNLVARYESATEVLLGLITTGCFWSDAYQELWSKVIRRVADPSREYTGTLVWDGLRWYPALLLMYGGGVAAIASRKWDNLASLLKTEIGMLDRRERQPVAAAISSESVFESGNGKDLPDLEGDDYAVSKHLFRVLKQPLSEVIQHDEDYERHFVMFDYLFSLIHADLQAKVRVSTYFSGLRGLFMSERQRRAGNVVMKLVKQQAKEQGNDWPPLKAGFFDGSYERFEQVIAGVEENLGMNNWLY